MDDFDNITCEEFYSEDPDMRAWLDELEREWINGELQMIAEEQAEARAEVEAEAFYFGA